MVFPNQTPHSAKQVEGFAMKKIIASIGLCLLIAGMPILAAAKSPKADPRPTAESLMAAEEGLAQAFRENNADGIQSYLSDDWAVVVALGQVEEGKELFPSGIGPGVRTLQTFETPSAPQRWQRGRPGRRVAV
jgi:hypothetical protein